MNIIYSNKIYILILILISFLVGSFYAKRDLVSFSAPPMFGGTDQLDYNNMAYAVMIKNIPGIIMTDEYKEPFKKFKNLKNNYISRVLNSKNHNLKTYAYRPLLYSIVLGMTYKVFGYSFIVARVMIIILILIGTIFLFLLIKNITNKDIAFFGTLLFFLFPNVIKYSNLILSEIFVVTLLIIFLYILQKSFLTNKSKYWVLTGLFLGMLILAKQMYYLISIPLISFFIFYLIKNREYNKIYLILVPFSLIVLPWFTYNIGITANLDLKTGTSGWHDMPSVYSKEYLEGNNRFKIREDIFRKYVKKHNIDKIDQTDHINRAIYGKKIFFEMVTSKDTLVLIPKLMYFKLKNALISNYYIYLILFIISIISIIFLIKVKQLSMYIISIIFIAYMNLFIISVTFSDSGRLISSTFPIFIIIFCILIYNFFLINSNKYKILI